MPIMVSGKFTRKKLHSLAKKFEVKLIVDRRVGARDGIYCPTDKTIRYYKLPLCGIMHELGHVIDYKKGVLPTRLGIVPEDEFKWEVSAWVHARKLCLKNGVYFNPKFVKEALNTYIKFIGKDVATLAKDLDKSKREFLQTIYKYKEE